MKKVILFTLIIIFLGYFAFSQELVLTEDFPGVTWPFLWDMEQDADGNLYVCSQQGVLYVKSNGVWKEYDLNTSSQADARSVAVDNDGVVWIATEEGLYSFSGNQVLNHYTSSNSDLPSDDLREIRAHGNRLWINLNGNGLAVKEGNNFTHITKSNSVLESNFIDDIEITQSGRVIIASSENVYFVLGNNWFPFDLDEMFGFQTWVYDIFIDHNQDIWFGTWTGVVKYTLANNQFQSLKSTYGENKYSAIIYTPNNELWLGELFEGLHYHDQQGNSFFYEGGSGGRPSQVFDFIYYQDTVRAVGNIGATVTGLTVDLNTSTSEVNANLMLIYPNPSMNKINIDVIDIDKYSAILYNSNGQIVYRDYNVQEVDVSQLSEGNYYLQLLDKNNVQVCSKKIMIVK